MQCFVYDTYVKAADGHTIHFDVIMQEKDLEKAITYGKEWLKSIGEGSTIMTSKECKYCHIESVPEPVEKSIKDKGYFIQTLEGCPKDLVQES